MSKNRLKLIIWLALMAAALVSFYLVITGLGQVVTYFGTGADPRSALNLIPEVPADLDERLHWEPDVWDGKLPPAFIRQQIAGTYLLAWAQWNISLAVGHPLGLETYFANPVRQNLIDTVLATTADGWKIQQTDLTHRLELTFYADDGQAVAFTDYNVPVVQQLTHPATGQIQIIESRATYQVVMVLAEGNWRLLTWQRLPPLYDIPPLTVRPPAPVPLHQGQLFVGEAPFAVAGINYYPQATPWTEFWPNYDAVQTRTDLAVVRSLGLNTVIIFIPFEQFGGDTPTETALANLSSLLDEAHQQELKVIVTLFDHRTDHRLSLWPADNRHLTALVPTIAGHPALLAWNLKNEPDLDYESNSPELVQAWLKHMAQTIRILDPAHPLTIGWSSPQAASALADVVDIVSYHYYAPAADYPRQLTDLRHALPPDKPLLLLEFGLPTWNTVWPNGHTEAEQAAYFADMLRVQRLTDSVGYAAWTLYDFESAPLPQFRFPWQTGPQRNMGVIRLNHTPKPAAQLLAPTAELSLAPVIPVWQRFTKPFWLAFFAATIMLGGAGLWAGWRGWRISRLWRQQWQARFRRHAAAVEHRRRTVHFSPRLLAQRAVRLGFGMVFAPLGAGWRMFNRLVIRNLPWRLTGRFILRRWYNWRTWRKVSRRHHVPRRVVEYIHNPPSSENISVRENHRQINALFEQILALQRHPQNNPQPEATLWETLGDLFTQTGYSLQASDAYRWAIKLTPQTAALYHKLGDLLEQQGLYEEALYIYRQQAEQFDTAADDPQF
jgi:tetratricopeptide (TPR) repeat protein